jgi:signal transduction histidine kinase
MAAAKIYRMTEMPGRFSTMRMHALRWLAFAFLFMAVLGNAMAQTTAPEVDLQNRSKGTQVVQSLFLDASQQLDFESAQKQTFSPFNPLARFGFNNKGIWLRLQIERTPGDVGPLFLILRPPYFEEVTLYSPAMNEPKGWRKKNLGIHEVLSKIEIGETPQTGVVYLRLASRVDSPLLSLVGNRDEMTAMERKLDVLTAVITTLIFLAFASMLWRTLRKFNWMSLLISVFLLFALCRHWLALGYTHTFMGMTSAMGVSLGPFLIILTISVGGGVFVLLLTALFPRQAWIRWLWVWPILQACLAGYTLLDPSAALRWSDWLWLSGPLVLSVFLLGAAWRDPSSLRLLASKIAFVALLIVCVIMVIMSNQSRFQEGLAGAEAGPEFLIWNLLLRGIQPLVIMGMASWIFERINSDRLHSISGELHASQESLGLETKRLERQRKFTAMLAHELKNPLAVSHMALSAIESRLGHQDPLRERSAAIKQSLQEIDGIIDRCSEIDGFEQGQLPMSVGSFTLNELMAVLKVSNPSERIYFLVLGIHDGAVLTSDIHYLKIIFSNLLTNALKYSPADTLIELAVESVIRDGKTRTLEFCVSNEVGEAGTPAPELAFERFYRAEAARNQSGAGLGLWLSQALAHAVGSELVMKANRDKISFTLALAHT